MDKHEQIKLAADLLGWTVDKAAKICKVKPEIDALYFYDKSKGGASLLMASDGSFLFANSTVSPIKHKKDFAAGKRTMFKTFLKK